jgi:DNA-directed RNA polymerase specialized sigma24 family protein
MQETLHSQFTTLMERGAFEPVRRHLSPVDQDDRMAEAVGQVWALAARRAALDIKLDNALLVHAVKLRAIDHRRQLPRGGQPRRDVLHLANFIDGRVIVHRLDGLLDENQEFTRDGDTDLQSAWLAATSADPADQLASAIDLKGWLAGLDDADRLAVEARYSGMTLSEIATATGRSVSAVHGRLKTIGAELALHAGITISKKPRNGRASPVPTRTACAA